MGFPYEEQTDVSIPQVSVDSTPNHTTMSVVRMDQHNFKNVHCVITNHSPEL